MANLQKQEACQLFIEQEIEAGLVDGKTTYAIGQEITEWIKTLFGADVRPDTIRVRADRYEQKLCTNVHNRAPEEFTDTERTIVKLYTEAQDRKAEQKREKKISQAQEEIARVDKNLPSKLLVYDVWNPLPFLTNKIRHPGNIPQEYIENLVYYYTHEKELVYDPFGGGGPTIDVCERMNRRSLVCDVFPIPEREGQIVQWNLDDGLPPALENPKLTFLDPPYYKKLEGDYVEESVSSKNRDDYLAFFEVLAQNLYEKHQPDTYVAFLMSNYVDYDDYTQSIWISDYVEMFLSVGFKIQRWLQCPLSPSQYQAFHVVRAKDNKQMLSLTRDLVVFVKEVV